jgi:hypothetical protein
MEIKQIDINKSKSNKRDIYIKDVIEMFKTEFVLEKDNVKYSRLNPNVRLHYLDIRDKFDMFYILDIIKYDISENFNLLMQYIDNKQIYINKILDNIKNIEYLLDKLIKNNKEIVFAPNTSYDKKDKQKYNFNKVINKYEIVFLRMI